MIYNNTARHLINIDGKLYSLSITTTIERVPREDSEEFILEHQNPDANPEL